MSECTWIKQPSRDPIVIPTRDGMKISLSGTVGRAADVCKRNRSYSHLEFGLRELEKHIEELRANPTEEMLGEFLSLWV